MSNPNIPTPIVDKNGKATIVYKRQDSPSSLSGRVASLIKPRPTKREKETRRDAVADYLNTVLGVSPTLIDRVTEATIKYPDGDGRNFTSTIQSLSVIPAFQFDHRKCIMLVNELFKHIGREADTEDWARVAPMQDKAWLEHSPNYYSYSEFA